MTDPRTALIWKSCAEGAKWDKNGCVGNSTGADWFQAMTIAKTSKFLGKSDWRLPSQSEFAQITGDRDDCRDNDAVKGQYAASKKIAHPIALGKDPGTFWTQSPDASREYIAKYVSFTAGSSELYGLFRDHKGGNQVRLVRSNSANDDGVALFRQEYAKIDDYKKVVAIKMQSEKQDANAMDKQKRAENTQRTYENSPAGIAKRQGRQMCEAQKQTCLASCPPYYAGKDTYAHHVCTSRCGDVSCN